MTLPLWWPRTCCVYCGRRLPDVRNGNGCVVPFPFTLACVKHGDLALIDPEWQR